MDLKPFVFGGLASMAAEMGNISYPIYDYNFLNVLLILLQ